MRSWPGGKEPQKMDNPLSWLTVTAAVAYLIGCLFRQAAYEIEERHAASERAWKEEGL